MVSQLTALLGNEWSNENSFRSWVERLGFKVTNLNFQSEISDSARTFFTADSAIIQMDATSQLTNSVFCVVLKYSYGPKRI